MGSRAVVVVCRDEEAARRALRRGRPGRGHRLHAHRPPLLRRRGRWKHELLARLRAALDACRALGGAGHRLGGPGLRADAVVGQGPGPAAPAVRRGGCRRAARRCHAAIALAGGRAGARPGRGRAAGALSGSGRSWPGATSTPTGATAGRSTRSTTSSWRRSTCWPARARSIRDRDHLWHMETLARVCAPGPGAAAGHARTWSSIWPTRPARRPASRWWEELTAAGGEGMVVKPLDFIAHGAQGPGAAGGEVPRPRVPAHHLRAGVHHAGEPGAPARARPGRQALAGAARVRAGHRRRWSASCAASRCAGSTSASSACWPWRANRSIRACRRPSSVH